MNFTSGTQNTSALHLAALNGKIDMVRVLIAAHADVNLRQSDLSTPLLLASKQGHHDVVRALIGANADVELPTDLGHTPLMWAAHESHPPVVEILLEIGADPNSAVNEKRRAALHFVYNVAGETSNKITNMLLDNGADIDDQDRENYTPLMAAAAYGNPGVANVLVVRGADVSLRNKEGKTAADIVCLCLDLDICANGRCQHGDEQAKIKALLQ